jgi:hypothetical protein
MKNESILDGIRRIRDEHAKEFNYDLDAIFADIKRHEREMKKEGWKFKTPKSPSPRPRKAA